MNQDICPWCGYEIGDLWKYSLDDGEDTETECPSCEKKINISLAISYDYTIKRSGCSHHTLDMHPTFWWEGCSVTEFQCTNCHTDYYDWMLPGGKHPKLKEGQFEFVGKAIKVAEAKGLLACLPNEPSTNLSE